MKVILMSKTSMNVEQYEGVTNIARTSTQITVTYGTSSTVTKNVSDWNLYVLET